MKLKSAILALALTQVSSATTLEEALISTYNTNQTLKQNQMDFLISAEGCSEARAVFSPIVTAQIGSVHYVDTPKTKFANSNSTLTIPGYGTVDLDNKVEKAKRGTIKNSLVIKQNLLDGQTYARVRSANLAFKAARAQLESNEQSVFFDAITAYLDYELAKAKYDASSTSVNFNSKQLESVEARLKVGESNNTQLALAQSSLSKAKSDQAQVFSELEGKKADFQEKIGILPDELESAKLPDLPLNLDEFKAKVLAFSPNLEYVRQTARSAQAQIAIAAGNLLPSLDFQLTLSRTHQIPETRTYHNNKTIESSLNLTIPIFNGASYPKLRQAKYQARKTAYAADYKAKQIDSQIAYLWQSFQSLKSALESAKVALEAQQLAFDGTMQEFRLGLKDILDVLKVESDLTAAKINKATVLRNYIFQAYQMKLFIGELTAKKLQLKVNYFDPDKELRKIKAPFVHF